MAATVTIDKAYFETMLRRAEFHASGKDFTTPVDLPVVTIPKIDHDNLLQMTQEYTALRDALYRGGITPETLEVCEIKSGGWEQMLTGTLTKVLVHGGASPQQIDQTIDGGRVESFRETDYPAGPPREPLARLSGNAGEDSFSQGTNWSPRDQGGGYSKDKSGFINRQYSVGRDDTSYPSELDRDDNSCPPLKSQKPFYNRAEQRTIVAQNLSDRTTHKDLVKIVRGGAVLDLFLRTGERSASISFVEGSGAQEFMNYVKRNDIYIHGKRVEFAWNDRQFLLPGHVANKISIGATRNLVIRAVHPNITEQRLREDLDHIHNLIIINIFYSKGDVHLSLNSVHNGLFARSCMMSRAAYKGIKIEWCPDECALPLPKQQWVPRKENIPQPAKKPSTPMNRFQMLNMDGTEDGSDDESHEDDEDSSILLTERLSSMKMDNRSPWNSTIAA